LPNGAEYFYYRGKKLKFYVGKNYFLVFIKDQIICIPRNGDSHFIIKDIPGDEVMAMTMFNGRIFAFSGKVTTRSYSQHIQETILFSCKPDGSDRKIHISTLRRTKQTLFDKQKPFIVSGLFADEKKHRLLFSCMGPVGGLWEFYPSTGKYKNYIDFYRSYYSWSMKYKDKLYVTDKNKYYIFDLKSNRSDFIFYKFKSTKHLKQKPQFTGQWLHIHPPFFVRNKKLWYGGYRIGFISLDKQVEDHYIFDMRGGDILPLPDGHSVLSYSNDWFYKITLSETQKGKNDCLSLHSGSACAESVKKINNKELAVK